MLDRIPSEVTIGDVFLPPFLVAGALGLLLTVLTAMVFNRYRISRFFFYPPLVLIALTVIYTVLIGMFLVPI